MKTIIAVLAALTILFSITVPAAALSKPAAPKISSVKNTAGGVLIKWSAVKNAAKYTVYRKTAKVKYQKIATVKTSSLLHKSAVSGKKYTYKVYAVNSEGISKPSGEKSITRIGTPTLKTSNTTYAVKAKWSKVKGATAYALLCKKSSAKKFSVLYRGTKQSYLYDNIGSGMKYDFKVKAFIAKAKGACSSVKTQMFLEKPSLHAEELVDMKGITLTWSSTKKAKGYIIYRSLKSENSYKRIAKTKTTSTKYIDSDLVSINSYKYYIKAYNGAYTSAKSNVDSDVYGYLESFSTPLTLTITKGEVYKDIYTKLDQYGATPFISWKSQNSKVAKVTATGVITGVSKGKTKLKAVIDPELISLYTHQDVTESKTVTIIVTVK